MQTKGNVVIDSKIYGALSKMRKLRCDFSVWIDATHEVKIKRHLDKGEFSWNKKNS